MQIINICDAVQIVLELARQNVIDESDAENCGLEEQREYQVACCDLVEDFAVNQLGDN